MKYIKKYETMLDFIGVMHYIIYYKDTKNGVNEVHKYTTAFDLEVALKKTQKLINSFLSLDKTEPRFSNWSLDNYWIEEYKNNKKIKIIDKAEIEARFDVDKYNI